MKRLFILSMVIGLFLNTSCKTTIMRFAGLRKPKIESKESIIKFLTKLKEDTTDVYTIDTATFQKLRKEQFKPGMTKGFRPAQIRMYGKNSEPLMQWASCEGFLSDLKIFDSVPPKIINGLNISLNLEDDLKQYFTLDGEPANIMVSERFDYYILIYFALYFPKLSKESFSQVDQYIADHPELKFKVFKINVDFQEFWNADLQIDSQTQIGGDN
jgi:hypothetical protein